MILYLDCGFRRIADFLDVDWAGSSIDNDQLLVIVYLLEEILYHGRARNKLWFPI